MIQEKVLSLNLNQIEYDRLSCNPDWVKQNQGKYVTLVEGKIVLNASANQSSIQSANSFLELFPTYWGKEALTVLIGGKNVNTTLCLKSLRTVRSSV